MFVPTKRNIVSLIEELQSIDYFDIRRIKFLCLELYEQKENSEPNPSDINYFLSVQAEMCVEILLNIYETPKKFMNNIFYATQTDILHKRMIEIKGLFVGKVLEFLESGAYYISLVRVDSFFVNFDFADRQNISIIQKRKYEKYLYSKLREYILKLHHSVFYQYASFISIPMNTSMVVRERYIKEIKYMLEHKKYTSAVAIIRNHVKDEAYSVYVKSICKGIFGLTTNSTKEAEQNIIDNALTILSDLPLVDEIF